ncbi:hypothetical protein RISK_006284 [Rhodopirellula islandica]|uniref:Uncharacterized protein n=1 Tax=Rhodopirellula islandica TaxID=595434 RepID=A0A0J1B4K7_RHOIS|nr:hypothetical protein RISK_006284 [Rhodopirellula islandica]
MEGNPSSGMSVDVGIRMLGEIEEKSKKNHSGDTDVSET